MVQISLYELNGKSAGKVDLSDDVFGEKENEAVVHQALTWFLASKRAGTASTLTRGEVSGGGKKPWKQKGTGRARVGSIRSPLWKGGGVIFGPKPRKYSYSLPKKVRKLALRVALSDKVKSDKVRVLQEIKLEKPKTAEMAKLMKNLKIEGKSLIILNKLDENIIRAGRNLAGVKLVQDKDLNIFDLLNANFVLFTKDSIKSLEENLSA